MRHQYQQAALRNLYFEDALDFLWNQTWLKPISYSWSTRYLFVLGRFHAGQTDADHLESFGW